MRYKGFVCVCHSRCGHWQEEFPGEKEEAIQKELHPCQDRTVRKMLCVTHAQHLQVYETTSSGALSLTGGALTTTLPFLVTEL